MLCMTGNVQTVAEPSRRCGVTSWDALSSQMRRHPTIHRGDAVRAAGLQALQAPGGAIGQAFGISLSGDKPREDRPVEYLQHWVVFLPPGQPARVFSDVHAEGHATPLRPSIHNLRLYLALAPRQPPVGTAAVARTAGEAPRAGDHHFVLNYQPANSSTRPLRSAESRIACRKRASDRHEHKHRLKIHVPN